MILCTAFFYFLFGAKIHCILKTILKLKHVELLKIMYASRHFNDEQNVDGFLWKK